MAPRRKSPPCETCKIGQRRCIFINNSICERCARLSKPCSGGSKESNAGMPEKPAEKPVVISPSSTSQSLCEQHLSFSLVWSLIQIYKDHVREAQGPYLDRGHFQDRVLHFNGSISKREDMDEVSVLVFMLAGAKLSTHSAVVGSAAKLSRKGVLDSKMRNLDGHLLGLARKPVIEAIASKLAVKLQTFWDNMTMETFSEDLPFGWVAMDELSSSLDRGERSAIMKRLFRRGVELGPELLSLDEASRKDKIEAMEGIYARYSGIWTFGLLQDDEPPIEEEVRSPSPTLADTPPQQMSTPPPSPPSSSALNEFPPPPSVVIKPIVSPKDPSDDLVIRSVVPPKSLQDSLKETQVLLTVQLPQIVYWSTTAGSPPHPDRLPPNPWYSSFKHLRGEAARLLLVWTTYRRVRGLDQFRSDLQPYRDQFFAGLSRFTYQADELMNKEVTNANAYKFATMVTQVIDFLKGDALLEWARQLPKDAQKILRILRYASLAHYDASCLVLELAPILESRSSEAPSDGSGGMASEIVEGALQAIHHDAVS